MAMVPNAPEKQAEQPAEAASPGARLRKEAKREAEDAALLFGCSRKRLVAGPSLSTRWKYASSTTTSRRSDGSGLRSGSRHRVASHSWRSTGRVD
jgi:hypothetical protein